MEVSTSRKCVSAPTGKATLSMLKGKSANTSVPSIAIRFHANEEELEQLYLSDSDVEKEYSPVIEDLKGDDLKNDKKGSPKRESSPMKDVFSKLSKRSSSVDSNIPIGEASTTTDRWRLFSEIKGKLTKTVEEKISEIKSGTKCPEQERTNEDTEFIRHKFSTSKENSSVSDSEDISVSEHSTSKFADVEMSSTNETEDEIEVSFPNKDSMSKDIDDQLFNDEIIISMPKKETVKHRFKKSLIPNMNVQYKTKEMPPNRDSYIETATEAFIIETPDDGDDTTPSELGIVNQMKVTKLHSKHISNDWIILSVFILLLSLIFTITSVPNYLAVFFTSFIILIYMKFTSNIEHDTKDILFLAKKMETLNRVQTPSIKTYEPVLKYETWMNEYPVRYNVNTYHISDTHSVYVRLFGSKLILSVGEGIRVPKRAMWNESTMPHLHLIKFTRHRVFSMIGAKVRLLPQGLARKRYWSKKYPICLEFSKVGKEYNKLPPEEETFDTNSLDSPTKRSNSSEKIATDDSLIENFLEQSVEQFAKINEPSESEQPVLSTPEGGDDGDLTDDAEETSVEWDTVGDVLDDITRIYLFTRTDRDKEDWFNYFVSATQSSNIPLEPLFESIDKSKDNENQSDNSTKSSPSHTANVPKLDEEQLTYNFDYQQFVKKMQHHKKNYENAPEQAVNEISSKVLWFNALLGRVLLDAVRQQEWVETLQQRIQRKLRVIKLPYFIEELVITELNLGTSVPIIHKISEPTFDSRGVWVDFDITYEGSVHGTLVTKLNLMKLKKPPAGQEIIETEKMGGDNNIPGPVFDSDLDDSAESSSEEDIIIPANWLASNTSSSGAQNTSLTPTSSSSSGNTTGKRLLKMVDKIAASKYFQQATDYKLIKKAMEGVSKTELKLRVELKGLVGVLTVNIPPPPSHRIWIGFRGNPQLWLNARPIVGERSLNFNHITSWIENKLQQEFQKILVLPNMEDFVIPIMNLNLPE